MSHDFVNIGKYSSDLVKRYEGNPIITSVDIPDPCNTVFNAGATLYKNKYILLLRVEDLEGKSKFYLAESTDGYDFEILNGPVFSKSTRAF